MLPHEYNDGGPQRVVHISQFQFNAIEDCIALMRPRAFHFAEAEAEGAEPW